jgi:putative endonuclease
MSKENQNFRTKVLRLIHDAFYGQVNSLGVHGEDLAVKYLKKKGYRILDRNFRLRGGEIDIIAKDGEEIVFIEVKTRTSDNREFIMASVGREKQRKISKTALYYISKNKYTDFVGRFDVIFVVGDKLNSQIEHIKDAFPLSENI